MTAGILMIMGILLPVYSVIERAFAALLPSLRLNISQYVLEGNIGVAGMEASSDILTRASMVGAVCLVLSVLLAMVIMKKGIFDKRGETRMVIWAFAATAAAVVMGLMLALYRRQVRKICRQMEFLKDNRTNLRITSDLPLSEFNELIDGINDILDRSGKDRSICFRMKRSLRRPSRISPMTSARLLPHWTDIFSFCSRMVPRRSA